MPGRTGRRACGAGTPHPGRRRAVPIDDAGGPPPGELTDDDRNILALPVTGAKDEIIARELDIGVRTLRRRMSHLLQVLDADTRFQAGIQATRRGWV